MRHCTEKFKKEVVKKILTPGVLMNEVCQKLNIREETARKWRRKYQKELQFEVENKFLESIQPIKEEEINIDMLLAEYDRKDLPPKEKEKEQTIDRILEQGKLPIQYEHQEKYLLVHKFRQLQTDKQGMLLRKAGLQSNHIKLWEEELLTMAKKNLDKNDYIKQLEEQNKKLQKQLKESEREKKELKILIELKKKYQDLFKEDEDN